MKHISISDMALECELQGTNHRGWVAKLRAIHKTGGAVDEKALAAAVEHLLRRRRISEESFVRMDETVDRLFGAGRMLKKLYENYGIFRAILMATPAERVAMLAVIGVTNVDPVTGEILPSPPTPPNGIVGAEAPP